MIASLRAYIVDDERLARNKLRTMLADCDDLEIVGEADTIRQAVHDVDALRPDVVFLDIQLPGESGFDLLHRTTHTFDVIFVTAFDQHAIRAFEVNALDYLLKPVTPARLEQALQRLQTDTLETTSSPDLPIQLERDDHLFLAVDDRPQFVQVHAIILIEAAGAYSKLHLTKGQVVLIQKPLKQWSERLPDKHFARIHRSTIINLAYIDRVEKWFNYTYRVFLKGYEQPFMMSRRYAAKLKTTLS